MHTTESIEELLRKAKFSHVTDEDLASTLSGEANTVTKSLVKSHLELCLFCERKYALMKEMIECLEAAAERNFAPASATVSPLAFISRAAAAVTEDWASLLNWLSAELFGVLEGAYGDGAPKTKQDIPAPSGHDVVTLYFTVLGRGGVMVMADAPIDCVGRVLRLPLQGGEGLDLVFAEKEGWACGEVFVPSEALAGVPGDGLLKPEWI